MMAIIRTIELSEVIAALPAAKPLRECNAQASADELYVCALGFEPRCLSTATALAAQGYKCRRAIVLEYSTNKSDNSINRAELMRVMSVIAQDVDVLDVDFPDFASRFRAAIARQPREERPGVTFDVGVASTFALMSCMAPLFEAPINLRVLYAEAEAYHPSEEEYNQTREARKESGTIGLDHGVGEVRISPEYPGSHSEPLPNCVIMFPSFNAGRSRAVLDKVDPSLLAKPGKTVVWMLGRPPAAKNLWRFDAMHEVNEIPADSVCVSVSTFDYKETLVQLEVIHRDFGCTRNITLSPLGSKMQTFGAAIWCFMHPDVRVLFAVPEQYNASAYSSGCREIWAIDFAPLDTIREQLTSVGSLIIE